MRICLTSFDAATNPGGMQWSAYRIGRLLADAGHEVHLVHLTPFSHDQQNRQATITPKPALLDHFPVFEIAPWLSPPGTSFAQHEVSTALAQLDEQYHYDVFHCLGIDLTGYLTTQVARWRNKPIILSARGTDINRGPFRDGYFPLLVWQLEQANWLTFVSENLLHKANSIVACKERASVIYNATDIGYFAGCTETYFSPWGAQETTFIIAGAGSLTLKKGAGLLACTMQLLMEKYPNLRLLWIGKRAAPDYPKDRFDSLLDELIAANYIHVTGWIPHSCMLRYLAAVDIFVLASPDEGCPNTVLEAMLARKPIVATAVGAVPDIVRHGKEGLLVPPYQVNPLADAIALLMENESLRKTLAEAAYQRVMAFCNVEQEKQAWLTCYERVVV